MKRIIFTLLVCGLMATPALALPSLSFGGSGPSATLESSNNGTNWTLSFTSGSIVVDASNPSPDAVLGDLIDLPSMTLSNLIDHGGGPMKFITATLTPTGSRSLTITPDGGGPAVMTASLGTGGTLVVGTNYVAYNVPQDDLDMTTYTTPGYSTVIDEFETYDASGYAWDLAFGGSSIDGKNNLYAMLISGINSGKDGSATLTVSGSMSILPGPTTTPAPGAVLLGSIGVALVGWLRRRRTL